MKKKTPYFIVTILSLIILLIVFISKDIYPFGNHTLIYSDMYDQITAFYYHFYDSLKGSNSLFIDFSTSGGINFFGILTYYISSPFSLLLLLFERDKIYLAVSILIGLKCILSSITMLYALRFIFKDKISNLLAVFLALSYAFSGYFFNLYIITPWMDSLYLFPLVVVGLKKTLELEKPYLYIITLTLSFITSFYVTVMSLIFILILSYIYINAYLEKKDHKKSIFNLGVGTLISILLSTIILIPSYLQISNSSRMNILLGKIFNSKLGPITDKMAYFIPSSFLILGILLFLLNVKKNKKFTKFMFPSLVILAIPYIIEPVNKMLHFGSYAMFPCRFGYITLFLLTICTAYSFTNFEFKTFTYNLNLRRIFSFIITILISVIATILLNWKYELVQAEIYKLTISGNNTVVLILFGSFIITFIGYLFISFFLNKNDKFYYYFVLTLFVTVSISYGKLYLGNDHYQNALSGTYDSLHQYSDLKLDNPYRVKNKGSSIITNNGMVSKIANLDHFTSLVDQNNLITLKKLGYQSYWTKTFSNGGTEFSDILLGNKYLTTKSNVKENYELIYKTEHGHKLYEYKKDISFGYFTKNINLEEERPSLNIQNKIYQAITGTDDNLFEIYDYENFNLKNVEAIKKYKIYYSIIDDDSSNYMEKEITFDRDSTLYLNTLNSLYHIYDSRSYMSLNVYVNDKLFLYDIPNKDQNGSFNLGRFKKGDKVNIKIELLKDTKFTALELGVMDNEKLDKFITEQKVNTKIKYNENKVIVDVKSDKKGLFFIPVNYIEGYKAKVNNKDVKLEKVYDNYLGVELEEGNNKIVFSYIPKGVKLSSIIFIVTLIGSVILFRFKIYDKIINNKILLNIVNYIYLIMYFVVVLIMYLIPLVCYIISYFIYI